MIKEEPKYEEWLTTIVNTRLLHNTAEEIESAMDNHSICSNGVKRSFSSERKMRSAYRDLKMEVVLMTDWHLSLDVVLEQYKEAWDFYKNNLARRKNPEEVALQMLSFFYYPYTKDGLSKKKLETFEQARKKNICIPFVIFMLLKIIPGYDSRNGDVRNMPQLCERAFQLLKTFTNGKTIFDFQSTFTRLYNEGIDNRLMLLYHFTNVLSLYESYAESQKLYETSSNMKQRLVNLHLDGYWNECAGSANSTEFWEIEPTCYTGIFFATHWHKSADNILTCIKYGMFTYEDDDRNLLVYMVHPESIKHRIKGLKYTDHDHTWYKAARPQSNTPDTLFLTRSITPSEWFPKINLTRVKDETVLKLYKTWKDKCEIDKRFADCDYVLDINMYAITQTHIYIPVSNKNKYYKIPKNAHSGFEQIKFGDIIGTLTLDNKVYLAFDEFMLYIRTDKNELKKYGITIEDHIE